MTHDQTTPSGDFYTRPPVQLSSSCPAGQFSDAFNPFEDPYLANPWPLLAAARETEPVFYSPLINHWVVTRHADIKAILMDHQAFSNRMSQSPVTPWPRRAVELFEARRFPLVANLNNSDPPTHTALRTFMRGAFTPRRLQWLEPATRRFIDEAIDALRGRRRADGGPTSWPTPSAICRRGSCFRCSVFPTQTSTG